MKEGMDIKSITQMYTEAHTVSHVRTRLQGDIRVNNVINCTLEREGSWTTKKSTAVECETSYITALNLCAIGGEAPTFSGEQASKLQQKFNLSVRKQVRTNLLMNHSEKIHDKVKFLAVQGRNLALAAAENSDLIWKSFMFDLKRGTLKFLLNAGIDTLPKAAN